MSATPTDRPASTPQVDPRATATPRTGAAAQGPGNVAAPPTTSPCATTTGVTATAATARTTSATRSGTGTSRAGSDRAPMTPVHTAGTANTPAAAPGRGQGGAPVAATA